MARQTFVTTDMQAINANAVQQVHQVHTTQGQQSQNNQQLTTQLASVKAGQTTTIIQPAQAHTGQQFIVTISGDSSGNEVQEAVQLQHGSGQVVYPAHQYVDNSSDSAIYAASNGQMQSGYSTEYSQAMYTPVTGAYYPNAQVASGVSQLSGLQGQILTHGGGTYLVQGGTMDGEGHPLTHTTRASPATVHWLIDNFECVDNVSLPRAFLYALYLQHCVNTRIDPVNAASFGKLIRSVFVNLKTRRLGCRNNSKYHYYGIRIKPTSPLSQFTDEQTMPMRQQSVHQGKWFKQSANRADGSDVDGAGNQAMDGATAQQHQHQQFLGDASGAIPTFGGIEMGTTPLPEGITVDNLRAFEELYTEHCEGILEVVVNLQFSLIEALWQSFWRNPSEDPSESLENEQRLPKDKLYVMCKLEAVQRYVRRSDYAFYQALVEVLIPDVLRPIPSSLTQAIRNFAKSLEGWLKSSMAGIPEEMIKTKIGAVSAFAQTLRRYTSLNHLAQAARAVLQNTSQINQMLTDLNRVDFANVQEQASWVCQCEDTVVHQLEQDFKKTLQQQNSLEQWAVWLEGVVNQVLQPHEGSPNFPKAARQFLLKWSFYSSMVIRDLTLRSAASFGSFHLIRLLYDEYMFYLVEHKVATATGETPIAVMGEFIDLGNAMALGNMDCDPPKPNVTVKGNSLLHQSTVLAVASSHQNTFTTQNHVTPTVTNVTPLVSVNSSNSSSVAAQIATLSNSKPTTVTVLATQGTGGQPGVKTVVVVPVSAATPGSGDAQPNTKRQKVN